MSSYSEYLVKIRNKLHEGIATEHSYRPALQDLIEALGDGISATNEPKRIACGAPDFKITRKTIPLGYIETKDIGVDLYEMEHGKGPHGEQFIRYRDGLPNWLLTDYLEFRWFVNGIKRLTTRFAELDAKGKIAPMSDGEQKLSQLFQAFLSEPALTVATAKDLATSMAHMTRIVRAQIVDSFKMEAEEAELHLGGPWLHNWLAAFRETLIPDLDEKQFADMFAQTLAYGLFAARIHTLPNKVFTREMAAYNLPKTNPFLRKLFAEIAGIDMPDSISWAVDDIVELLNHANMAEILKDFGKGKGKEDPVVHFYETFLAAYDPKMRKVRGIYYTPEPVVSYIVRSIDYLLKTRFDRPKGLADENTLILDPATGTATFLYFVIDQIHQKFVGQAGAWDDYVAKHLLRRVFGFELLMAPYSVAHLKLGMQLEQTGYKFGSDQRLGIYLTNTLEEAAKKSELLFASWVAEEANAAASIKRDEPILVVLGNPPYSNFGRMNRGKWILSLLDDYKRDLHERKLNIDDDFIKFIRFAQWRIERTGHGIIGLITNNTYLDGITHRRMRECLMNTFNEIYILNLHGDLRKKETAPDGSKDENVFDITIGVAIALFVKLPNTKGCRVFHADLSGDRESKYKTLWQNDVSATEWQELKPQAEYFFLTPKDFGLESEYKAGWSVKGMFGKYISGIQTGRDSFVSDLTEADFAQKIVTLKDENLSKADIATRFELPNFEGFNLDEFRTQLRDKESAATLVTNWLYRPFDVRPLFYHPLVIKRMRGEVMASLLHKNIALITVRQLARPSFAHVLITKHVGDGNTISLNTREYSYYFPLYIYPQTQQSSLNGPVLMNLNPDFMKVLAEKLNLPKEEQNGLPKSITPEDIINYAYAVFHSPTYRMRYAEFLKIDFPRLPLTRYLKLFRSLAAEGAELVALHMLESPKVQDFITGFPEKGDNVIGKVRYTENDKRLWINKTQYFSGVPKAVWEFHIGGYQVCEKWMKDRKGRKLSYNDIQHYQKIQVALNETIRLMSEIDSIIPSWPIT